MKSIRRAGRVAIALAVLVSISAAARAEGVLDQVPADAWVVFRVNRLEQTNKKAAAWAEAMGIAQLSPQCADPLGALEKETNIKGLDKSKDLAICFVDPANAGGKPDKSILILVPTNDYKALVGSLPNSKTDGELTTFKPEGGDDKPGYVANWGNYAAMSPTQALVSKKPGGGLKLSGLAAKEMQQKDAVVYANIPAMREKLLPELRKLRANVKKQMQAELGGGNVGGDAVEAGNTEGASPTPSTTPGNRPRPGTRPPPAQRPGQRPAGGQPQSRLDESAADVELTALQQQPSRQPGRRPAPARRPQATPPVDADATSPGKAGANDAAAAMKQYAPAIGELADQYFNAAEKFLTDANAASFSLNLTDAGLNTTMMAESARSPRASRTPTATCWPDCPARRSTSRSAGMSTRPSRSTSS